MPTMTTVLLHSIDDYAHAPQSRSMYTLAGAGLVVGAVVWSFVGVVQASDTTTTVPLYPTEAQTISMVDVPNLTVLQVLHKLPITSRFDILLSNSGTARELGGDGPYTIFAPADNYFDYLPSGAYVSLTRAQERELAEHMVVSGTAIDTNDTSGSYITLAQDTMPIELTAGTVKTDNAFAIRGYRARNGIVYVTNKVLPPAELQTTLGGE